MVKLNTLSKQEKRVFRYHLVYSVIDGTLYGALALNEFILLKSLKGTDYQVGILFQIPAVVLLFGVIFNELIRRSQNKKRFIRMTAVLTRLPLAFVIFFPSTADKITPLYQYLFLAILTVYYLSTPLLFPTINVLLKNSYSHDNFGRLYSYATSVSKIFALISTFILGWLLDLNYYSFRYIFLALGIAGIVAVFILTEIDYRADKVEDKLPLFRAVRESIHRMFRILGTNKPFLHFEIAFFIYGMAFLSTSGVISLLLNNVLGLNYSSLAFYKDFYNLINILLLPVFGHYIGRTDPRKFGIFTYLAMAMFLFFLFLSYYVKSSIELWNIRFYLTLVLAYIFYGVFSALMGLLWYIGSSYFGSSEHASDYQSIHVTFTGLRGSFAPLMGIALYRVIGYSGVFLLGIWLLLLAMGVMIWSMRRERL